MNKQQTLQVQLQILKAYALQKHPLIALTVKNENLYFGSCIDPVTRVAEAHKINLFPKAPIFFLHRQSQQIEQGLIQLLFTSFFTLQFVNRVFFGAPGLINYICGLQTLLGVRQLAFAAYEFQTQQQKLGFSDRNHYIKAIGQAESYNFHGKDVNEINKFVLKHSKDPLIPIKLMKDNVVQSENYFKVIPICSENAVQYLILFKKIVEVNKDWLKKNGIPLGRFEQLKCGQYKKNGQLLQVSENELYSNDFGNMYTAILVLNFESKQEIEDFDLDKFTEYLKQYQNEFAQYTLDKQQMIVIHDSNLQLLQSDHYKVFVQKISKILQTFHIVVVQDIDNDIDQENQYYHLEYLKCMSESLPKLFQSRKQSQIEFNIQQIWPLENIQPLQKFHQIIIQKNNMQFDSTKQLIHFYPKQEMIQLLQKLYQKEEQQLKDFSFYFTPLGTSSSTMNQSRSVSCWHFQFRNGLSLLLDCGMGTLDQLYYNCVNDQEFQDKLTQIKIIYISHFHNDHHQGLINLLTKIFQYSNEDIFLILPYNILLYYDYELDKLPFKNKIKIIFPSHLFVNQQKTITSGNPTVLQYINSMQSQFEQNYHQFTKLLVSNNISIKLQFSHHCEASTYIKLSHKNNTIIYSSDRKGKMDHKSTSFAMFSEQCDIMIHECTYPDDMQDRAEEVAHSTFCQAIEAALQSKARYLILTHFTEKSLFYLKSLIDDTGQFIEEKIQKIFVKSGYDLNRLNEFMQKKVIIANDFQRMSDRNLNSLPQISRMIMKMLHP